jgi:trans-2-enoyl-CoA reductase
MYPQNAKLPFLLCDQIYSRDEIIHSIAKATILDFGLADWGEGINRMREAEFEEFGKKTLEWCYSNGNRAYIISHDGTITNYRMLLGEKGLTRNDFLGEAGIYRTHFEGSNSKKGKI